MDGVHAVTTTQAHRSTAGCGCSAAVSRRCPGCSGARHTLQPAAVCGTKQWKPLRKDVCRPHRSRNKRRSVVFWFLVSVRTQRGFGGRWTPSRAVFGGPRLPMSHTCRQPSRRSRKPPHSPHTGRQMARKHGLPHTHTQPVTRSGRSRACQTGPASGRRAAGSRWTRSAGGSGGAQPSQPQHTAQRRGRRRHTCKNELPVI